MPDASRHEAPFASQPGEVQAPAVTLPEQAAYQQNQSVTSSRIQLTFCFSWLGCAHFPPAQLRQAPVQSAILRTFLHPGSSQPQSCRPPHYAILAVMHILP